MKKIAVICYDFDVNALTERRQGCIDMLRQYKLLDPGLIKDIRYQGQEEEIKQAIHDLKNYPDKIDAYIFLFTESIYYRSKVYVQKRDKNS